MSLDEKIAFRARHLTAYQNKRLARRYQALVARADDPALKEALALGYHRLLAYKDEYEVARLMRETRTKAEAEFDGDLKFTIHLAPPILAATGPDGRPKKRAFGGWMLTVMDLLARFKFLRGTALDPFARGDERRMERALIAEYEADMEAVLSGLTADTLETAVELARLPLDIRGFGPVKAESVAKAAKRREALLQTFRASASGIAAQ